MARDQVTLRDVYDIAERLEKKMDTRFEDHEKRIRANENAKVQIYTVATVITVAFNLFGDFIKTRLSGGR